MEELELLEDGGEPQLHPFDSLWLGSVSNLSQHLLSLVGVEVLLVKVLASQLEDFLPELVQRAVNQLLVVAKPMNDVS